MKTIFTIGHSTRAIEEFLALLKAHGIEEVVDVRTIPPAPLLAPISTNPKKASYCCRSIRFNM